MDPELVREDLTSNVTVQEPDTKVLVKRKRTVADVIVSYPLISSPCGIITFTDLVFSQTADDDDDDDFVAPLMMSCNSAKSSRTVSTCNVKYNKGDEVLNNIDILNYKIYDSD